MEQNEEFCKEEENKGKKALEFLGELGKDVVLAVVTTAASIAVGIIMNKDD